MPPIGRLRPTYTTASILGRGSAVIAALSLVSGFAQLNLANTLPRFLSQAGRRGTRLVVYCYGASATASLVGGALFVTVFPRLSPRWEFVDKSTILGIAFVAATVIWGIFALEDAVLLSVRRSAIVPVENALYGVGKLVLLVGFASLLPSVGIFMSWVVPLVAVVPCINLLIFGRFLRRAEFAGDVATVRPREVVQFASLDYIGTMFGQTYGNVLPLIVLSVLGAGANGEFYVALSIATGLQLVATNFGTSLLVEGARAPDRIPELTRGVLLRCMCVLILGATILSLGAPIILRVYGDEYAVHASLVLGLLAIGCIPFGLVSIAVSLDRMSGRVGLGVATRVTLATSVLGCSWLLMRPLGITGVGVAWVAAHLVVAMSRTPTVIRALRGPPSGGRKAARGSHRRTRADNRVGRGSKARGSRRRSSGRGHRVSRVHEKGHTLHERYSEGYLVPMVPRD